MAKGTEPKQKNAMQIAKEKELAAIEAENAAKAAAENPQGEEGGGDPAPPSGATPDAPYGYLSNGKPRKRPAYKKAGEAPQGAAGAPGTPLEILPPFDKAAAEKEALVIMELLKSMRRELGVQKDVSQVVELAIISGYPGIAEKYGSVAGKYMPEIMFFGGIAMLALDTFRQISAMKAEKREKEAKPVKPNETEEEILAPSSVDPTDKEKEDARKKGITI